MSRRQKNQLGIAVITVLLALGIAVLICSEVLMRVYGTIKRSGNYFDNQQALEYALGGEAWARQQLAMDFEKDKASSRVDHFLEKWALPSQKMVLDGGSIEMEIYDMQARFNLNNLVDENGLIDAAQVDLFRGLITYVGVRPVYADLAARWASYADDTDNMYNSDKSPFYAGDTQFGSVSELKQLKDIEMKEYRRMQPFLSVLPVPVTININTASEPVLAAMVDNTEPMQAVVKSFIEQRKQLLNGYSSPDAFIQAVGLDEDELGERLGVSSEYFEVRVIAEYGGKRVWLISTLFRDEQTGEISLLSRDTSQRFTFGNSLLIKDSDLSDEKNRARDTGDKKGQKDEKYDKENEKDDE